MESNFIKNIYSSNRNIIIGLTGRTGSGCSTVASYLKTENFNDLGLVKYSNKMCADAGDLHKYKENLKKNIIYDFMAYGDNWRPFKII